MTQDTTWHQEEVVLDLITEIVDHVLDVMNLYICMAATGRYGLAIFLTVLVNADLHFVQDSRRIAEFAIQILTMIVLLTCLCLSARFVWYKASGGRDRLRNGGYKYAAGFFLM